MGKRKYKDKEEHLERKMKKLQHKMDKLRRRRNSSSRSSSPELEEIPFEDVTMDNVLSQEVEQCQDTTQEEAILVATSEETNNVTNTEVADVPLDQSILNVLGDAPATEDVFSASIHNDIAVRWTEILRNGLKEEITKDISSLYNVPENLKLAKPPLLNPEIKAAVNESFIKRDGILAEKQKHLSYIISSLAQLMSNMINKRSDSNNSQVTTALKQLSDAGRLLCNLHYSETNTRKHFLVSGLSKNIKDNIKDLKRDQWLFGDELSEKLRSLKAISKTGAEMKATSTTVKPKVQPRNRLSEASTSRALNWRGPPPPPPRPTATRYNWPAGGRRQPPTTQPLRAAAPLPPQRRAMRPHQQSKRR